MSVSDIMQCYKIYKPLVVYILLCNDVHNSGANIMAKYWCCHATNVISMSFDKIESDFRATFYYWVNWNHCKKVIKRSPSLKFFSAHCQTDDTIIYLSKWTVYKDHWRFGPYTPIFLIPRTLLLSFWCGACSINGIGGSNGKSQLAKYFQNSYALESYGG